MSIPILSCPCGLRMKAKGATPGRVGRCPRCGETLTVPGPAKVEARVEPKGEPVARGYGLKPTFHPAVAAPSEGRPARRGEEKRRAVAAAKEPVASRQVEPWWRPAALFPLRGAEALLIVAMIGMAAWFVATLIPELCLQFIADGGFLMGMLVSLIVALPTVGLGFFAATYALQYLGRVLVSGALGEVVPPRPPDRNFDGLAAGLAPWAVWLACGATLGLGPLASYLLSRSWDEPARPVVVLLLAVVGLPYAMMALMMAFVRDGGLPSPFGVVGALVRFNLAFLALCAVEVGLGLVVAGAFYGVLGLREGYFWAYIPLMLPCWMLALWAAIVGMRVLGVFYHHHASILRWHRKKPWWDVTIAS